ncbi:MAG: hypothetical protein GXO44_03865 [Deferribacteres bacterium]|nr:hypothetical protein [Deferribacteres bacterium]
MGGFLLNLRDPMGVPFHPVVFQVLMILTFALHIMFVNFVVGGTLIALWGRLRGDKYGIKLSKAFARANTVNTSVAIVLGVAPLLFVQVIYDPLWYNANNISAWWALFFLITIAAAFTCAYLFYLGKSEKGGNPVWSLLSLAALVLSGVIIHAISVQMLHPEKWSQWITASGKVNLFGNRLYGFSLPRFLHFMVPSVALAGVYMMLYSWYFREREDRDPNYVQWVGELGVKIAIFASLIQAAVGVWWLLTIPSDLGFMTNPFFLVGALVALAFIGWLFVARKDPAANGLKTALFAFVAVFAMAASREALRSAYLSRFNYSILTYKINWSIGSTLLFFATFVMGLIVISYPLLLAFHAGRTPDSRAPLKLEGLNKLGRLVVFLPVLWLIVVVALGISISIKNGVLF